MGNVIFREAEFPPHIKNSPSYKHLPNIGDIVDFDPCFQSTRCSAVLKAGPPSKAVITKIKYGVYVNEDTQPYEYEDVDYDFIVYGKVLTETSITTDWLYAYETIFIPKGLETILRYKVYFKSVGTDADGWIILND
jgi:hypothetical protein